MDPQQEAGNCDSEKNVPEKTRGALSYARRPEALPNNGKNATPKAMMAREMKERTQEMKDKHGIPRPGHSAGDRVGVDEWKRVDFTGRGEGRPRGAEPGSDSFSREETQPMEMTAPANPLAEILGRLMPLLPLAERWLEKQVGEQAGPKAESEDSSPLVKEWYTPEEASVLLRLHVQTVMKWCREGKIEASKAGGNERNGRGGKWLIPRESINAYLHRQRVIHGQRWRNAK